jgi:hypothetical protein
MVTSACSHRNEAGQRVVTRPLSIRRKGAILWRPETRSRIALDCRMSARPMVRPKRGGALRAFSIE